MITRQIITVVVSSSLLLKGEVFFDRLSLLAHRLFGRGRVILDGDLILLPIFKRFIIFDLLAAALFLFRIDIVPR